VFGPAGDTLAVPPKRNGLQQSMLDVLRAACAVVDDVVRPFEMTPRFCVDVVQLSEKAVKGLRIPLVNLAFARRALRAAGSAAPFVVRCFVDALGAFYLDLLPQRATAATARAAQQDAAAALSKAESAVEFAVGLLPMTSPFSCEGESGVREVSNAVAQQMRRLAFRGLALPALHIEHIRKAIDRAGLALFSARPSGDPVGRLRWAEAATAIQLAPMPALESALADIASSIDPAALAVAVAPTTSPSSEIVRLLAAAIWVASSDCRCDASWRTSRQYVLNDPSVFVRSLAAWKPSTDASASRLTRARELLQDVWGWFALGSARNPALDRMFAWASLAVTMTPLVEAAQRLLPVHAELRKGLQRIQRAPPDQARSVASKAWTAALFLLDASGEPWWWLELIRPATVGEPPWTDAEDGALGIAPLGTPFGRADVRAEGSNIGSSSASGLGVSSGAGAGAGASNTVSVGGEPMGGQVSHATVADAAPNSDAGDIPRGAGLAADEADMAMDADDGTGGMSDETLHAAAVVGEEVP